MATETAINIGLKVGNDIMDLRVPRFVTMEQLHGVVANGLISLSVALPKKWSLRLISKDIEIKPGVPLSEYPLSNGDQLILDTE